MGVFEIEQALQCLSVSRIGGIEVPVERNVECVVEDRAAKTSDFNVEIFFKGRNDSVGTDALRWIGRQIKLQRRHYPDGIAMEGGIHLSPYMADTSGKQRSPERSIDDGAGSQVRGQ